MSRFDPTKKKWSALRFDQVSDTMKVDVFKQVGSFEAPLNPDISEQKVYPLSTALDALRLKVTTLPVKTSLERTDNRVTKQRYLNEHGVQELLSGAVDAMLREEPESARKFLYAHLQHQQSLRSWPKLQNDSPKAVRTLEKNYKNSRSMPAIGAKSDGQSTRVKKESLSSHKLPPIDEQKVTRLDSKEESSQASSQQVKYNNNLCSANEGSTNSDSSLTITANKSQHCSLFEDEAEVGEFPPNAKTLKRPPLEGQLQELNGQDGWDVIADEVAPVADKVVAVRGDLLS